MRFTNISNTWHLKRSVVHNQNFPFYISPAIYRDKLQLFDAIARIVYVLSDLAMCSSHFPCISTAPHVTSWNTPILLPAKLFLFLNLLLLANIFKIYNAGIFYFLGTVVDRKAALVAADCYCYIAAVNFKWPALTAPFSHCRRFIRQGAKLLAPAKSERTAEHITALCF